MYTIILNNLMISDVHCQGNDRKPNENSFGEKKAEGP